MRTFNIKLTILFIAFTICSSLLGQELSINILQQPASLPVGGLGTIQVDICNNDGGVTLMPTNKISPLISVPSTLLTITGVANLPTGWEICSNTGQSIRLTNGSDGTLEPLECRTFLINVTAGNTPGGPNTISGTLGFTNGTFANRCNTLGGSQTINNLPSNDNSQTTIIVTDVTNPLRLTSFEVKKEGSSNRLNWVSEDEQSFDGYEIQRSTDAQNFSKIGWVKPQSQERSNKRNYDYLDNFQYTGTVYYRLKMVDLDGSFFYSAIRTVDQSAFQGVKTFPNPADETFRVEFQASPNQNLKLNLMDVSGKIVQQEFVNTGSNQVDFFAEDINTSSLRSGIYILQIQSDRDVISTQKVMVLHDK